MSDGAATVEQIGYIWLFAVNGCLLLRLLLDASMVRRPMFDPNLSVGGLTFLGHIAVRVSDGQRGDRHAERGRSYRIAAGRRVAESRGVTGRAEHIENRWTWLSA